MKVIPWTPDEDALIRKLWLEGYTAPEIAAEMGGARTWRGVSKRVERSDYYKLPRAVRSRPPIDRPFLRKYDHAEAARLYAKEGLSTYQIAKQFGVDASSIRTCLKKQGVTLSRRNDGQFRPQREPKIRAERTRRVVHKPKSHERVIAPIDAPTVENDTVGCQFIADDPRVNPAKCAAPRIIRNGRVSSYCGLHHAICWVAPAMREAA